MLPMKSSAGGGRCSASSLAPLHRRRGDGDGSAKRESMVVDVDLTGRQVSSTSTDYADADFGWMEDDVKKGYQAAMTSLVCERWKRLMLTLQRYPGRTLSAECLQAAVGAVEELLGVRPRQRVELIRQRRGELATRIQALEEALDDTKRAEGLFWQRIRETRDEMGGLRRIIADLEVVYPAQRREERPYSRLTKAHSSAEIGREARKTSLARPQEAAPQTGPATTKPGWTAGRPDLFG